MFGGIAVDDHTDRCSMDNASMIIGLCGGEVSGFPAVQRALRTALPDAELVDVPLGHANIRLPRVDVLVPLGATVDAAVMDGTQPRLIHQFGVGLQGVDLTAAEARDIPVAFVPGAESCNAVAVAEIAMLHLLMLLRRYPEAQRGVAERQLGQPCGTTLIGKTVTVLGVGAIGTAVLSRLQAFGAHPVGVGRREWADYPALEPLLPPERYQRIDDLSTALACSQALIVCLPLTTQTRGLIGTEQLAAMSSSSYLINVARGGVIDHSALVHALNTGHLAGAGLDVTWEEPIDPDDPVLGENVTVTPHIGGDWKSVV